MAAGGLPDEEVTATWSSAIPPAVPFSLHGPERTVGADRVLHTESSISAV
jgi:hypothetical protein